MTILPLMPVPVYRCVFRRIMPVIMLALFALPSFGISMTLSRLVVACETAGGSSQSQTEELEERVLCSTERREHAQGIKCYTAWPLASWTAARKRVHHRASLRGIVGHRLANGSRAPIRC